MIRQAGEGDLGGDRWISVCVCTYRRTVMLERLLLSLARQRKHRIPFGVVVVDNDSDGSARDVVTKCRAASGLMIDYAIEPEKNISMARNRAVALSRGTHIAFIDDDEFPSDRWLLELYNAHHRYMADGVFGPVLPFFAEIPPKWLVRSKLCDRPRYPTGTVLKYPRDTRTGNVLLSLPLLKRMIGPFDRSFGLIGGEDDDLFRRMLSQNARFVWSDDATAFEEVPAERLEKPYHIRRALLRGYITGKTQGALRAGLSLSLLACIVYTLVLPVLWLSGEHFFMKYLVKDCDHIGKILGVIGISPVKDRRSLAVRCSMRP